MGLIRHRNTARVLLQAKTGRFLLFLTHWHPASGLEPRWVSPGGGIEPNEPIELAASRELVEETGLLVGPEVFGTPIAKLSFRQEWQNGDHETGEAVFFRLKVADEFEPSRSSWTADEHRDIIRHAWWLPSDLNESGESVGPPGLGELLAGLVRE